MEMVGRNSADALIGPRAYVNFDVPAKSIVIGNPGQIVSQSGSAGYINNVMEARVQVGVPPPPSH